MNKNVLLLLIEETTVDTVQGKIQAFLSDPAVSYEDKKEVYLATPDHLQTVHSYVMHLDKFEEKYGEISWYDDCYVEKYNKVDLVDVITSAEKDLKDDPGYRSYEFLDTREKLDDFTRECVESGYHAFIFDW